MATTIRDKRSSVTMKSTSQQEVVSELVKEKSLRYLLDGLVIAQKQDIQAFSKGHLNESNLPKPPDKAGHHSWQSATKPQINLVPRSTFPRPPQTSDNNAGMTDTLMNFSLGTNYLPRKPNGTPMSKSSLDHRHRPLRKSPVLIEELSLTEAMLVKTRYPQAKSEVAKSGQVLDLNIRRAEDESNEKTLPALKIEHTFVPGHLEAVTKRDQMLMMREFEDLIIRKQDASEQNVMSGVKAVAHIETKLQQGLDQLERADSGPKFHRLQIFSNVLDDMIQDSSTFGFILQTIKNEYDRYISMLMEEQAGGRHQLLLIQLDQLSSRDNNSETLQHEMSNVQCMEVQAKSLLAQNERLRKELDHEKYLRTKPVVEQSSGEASHYLEEKQDLMETVEELKATILEKLDVMNSLKTKLRLEYVPSTVCSHLEQCIKETEVEIQKLTSQKEFFERSISDLEADLQQAIETADTTEKDARRVWKRVTAVKAVDRNALMGSPGAGVTTTGPGGNITNPYDSDDEQEDEQKWNWYIS